MAELSFESAAHNGAMNTSGPPGWLSYNIRFKVRSPSSYRWAKIQNYPVPSTNVALASIFHPPALFDATRDGLLQGWNPRDQESLSYLVCSVRKQNSKIKCSLSARTQIVFTCRPTMLEYENKASFNVGRPSACTRPRSQISQTVCWTGIGISTDPHSLV